MKRCYNCRGLGIIPFYGPYWTLTKECSVCNGTGTIIAIHEQETEKQPLRQIVTPFCGKESQN